MERHYVSILESSLSRLGHSETLAASGSPSEDSVVERARPVILDTVLCFYSDIEYILVSYLLFKRVAVSDSQIAQDIGLNPKQVRAAFSARLLREGIVMCEHPDPISAEELAKESSQVKEANQTGQDTAVKRSRSNASVFNSLLRKHYRSQGLLGDQGKRQSSSWYFVNPSVLAVLWYRMNSLSKSMDDVSAAPSDSEMLQCSSCGREYDAFLLLSSGGGGDMNCSFCGGALTHRTHPGGSAFSVQARAEFEERVLPLMQLLEAIAHLELPKPLIIKKSVHEKLLSLQQARLGDDMRGVGNEMKAETSTGHSQASALSQGSERSHSSDRSQNAERVPPILGTSRLANIVVPAPSWLSASQSQPGDAGAERQAKRVRLGPDEGVRGSDKLSLDQLKASSASAGPVSQLPVPKSEMSTTSLGSSASLGSVTGLEPVASSHAATTPSRSRGLNGAIQSIDWSAGVKALFSQATMSSSPDGQLALPSESANGLGVKPEPDVLKREVVENETRVFVRGEAMSLGSVSDRDIDRMTNEEFIAYDALVRASKQGKQISPVKNS